MLPALLVSRSSIAENSSRVCSLCRSAGVEVFGVTKGVCGDPRIASAMLEGGCSGLADSRLENIARMREAGLKGPFMLLRIPSPSRIGEVARLADVVLVSEGEVLRALDEACASEGRRVQALLMVDVGDLREGIWPDEVRSIGRVLGGLRWVRPIGVATNVGCFGGVLPDSRNMGLLLEVKEALEEVLGEGLPVASGSGTVGLRLVEEGTMPAGINQLRIGEAILLGRDTTGDRVIGYLRQDTMRLQAEVIEVKRKPSVPIGEVGLDAFGRKPAFVDRGVRRRALLALGKQDVHPSSLTPLEEGVEVLGASSDHTVLDVEGYRGRLEVGQVLSFSLDYPGMLSCFTSPYVEKRVV